MFSQQFYQQVQQWRQHLHMYPETAFAEESTAQFLKGILEQYGITDIHGPYGKTGFVVNVCGEAGPGESIAIRADMDALPIHEQNDFDYCSKNLGKMHACGHDGHMALALGALVQLHQMRKKLKGTVRFIFQPAEEGAGGAQAMVADGLLQEFPFSEIYALHNWPGLEAGEIAVLQGPVMAASDRFFIRVKGKGGHAAMPHLSSDPVLALCRAVTAVQDVLTRNHDPLEPVVLSTTMLQAGSAFNVIPDAAEACGGLRTLKPATREKLISELKHSVSSSVVALGCTADFSIDEGYIPVINSGEAVQHARRAAEKVFGENKAHHNWPPSMASEDFQYLAEQADSSCYIFLGNGPGENNCLLHNPAYDFNDSVIARGVDFWVTLVCQRLS